MNKTELAKEWLDMASMDLRSAQHLFDTLRPKPLEIICYHCQQGVEKALKGFLISCDVEPLRTHDLDKLCVLCMEHDSSFHYMRAACAELTDYAASARYPSHVEIEEADAVSALDEAKRIYVFCEEKIDEPQLKDHGQEMSQ